MKRDVWKEVWEDWWSELSFSLVVANIILIVANIMFILLMKVKWAPLLQNIGNGAGGIVLVLVGIFIVKMIKAKKKTK